MTHSREPSERRQSALFGLVLGLIIGLAIAVLAALYITHSPKPQPRKEDQSAQQGSKMDPIEKLELQLRESKPSSSFSSSEDRVQNAPLSEPQIQEPIEDVQEPSHTQTVPATPVAPTPSSKTPSASTISEHTDSSRSAPSALVNNVGTYLQIGAYKTRTIAEQQRAHLALQGFSSKVTSRAIGAVTYYRVRLGPFTSLSDADQVRVQLSAAGIDAMLVQESKLSN